jgi:hypothetical protein
LTLLLDNLEVVVECHQLFLQLNYLGSVAPAVSLSSMKLLTNWLLTTVIQAS